RGVRAVVTRREAGRRWTCRVAAWLCRADEQHRCGREVVWSWPPDAEVKPGCDARAPGVGDGGNKAGPQGEHETSVKTIAQGRLGSSGCTCGSCPVLLVRTGAMGVSRRPVFPAPSICEGERSAQLGRL